MCFVKNDVIELREWAIIELILYNAIDTSITLKIIGNFCLSQIKIMETDKIEIVIKLIQYANKWLVCYC